MPDPTLGDAGVAGRIVRGKWPVRIVVGKVAAPYLLEHRDRRRAADLLMPDVPGFVVGLLGGVSQHEGSRGKHLEPVGVSAVGGGTPFHVGVIALAVFQRPVQGEQRVGVVGAEVAALVGVAGLQQNRMALRTGRQRRNPSYVEVRAVMADRSDPAGIDVDSGIDVGKHCVGCPAVPEFARHGEELLGPLITIGVAEEAAAPEVLAGECVR